MMAYNFWTCPLCCRKLREDPVDPDGYFHCPDCGTLDPTDIDVILYECTHREEEDYETGRVFVERR